MTNACAVLIRHHYPGMTPELQRISLFQLLLTDLIIRAEAFVYNTCILLFSLILLSAIVMAKDIDT